MDWFGFWTVPDHPAPDADCLVVLSYAVTDERVPTAPTRAAIRKAASWLRQYPHSLVIMSTGDNQHLGIPNSRVMKDYGMKMGIPARNIVEEARSLTTYENLKYSERLFNKFGRRRLMLVLYDLHVRRTLAIARAMGWRDIRWISATGPGSSAFGIKRFQTFSRLSVFLYEIGAFVYNRIRGEV